MFACPSPLRFDLDVEVRAVGFARLAFRACRQLGLNGRPAQLTTWNGEETAALAP